MSQDRERINTGNDGRFVRRDERDATKDPLAHPDEPGAYVGRKPERQAETIPGGVRPDDERIAAHSTQVGDTSGVEATPDGHPEGNAGEDDLIREAGQDR